MKRKNVKISGIVLSSVIIIVSFVYAVNIPPVVTGISDDDFEEIFASADVTAHTDDLRSFASYKEFTDFLNNCSSVGYRGGYDWYGEEKFSTTTNAVPMITVDLGDVESHDGSDDFSTTNNQVLGVDEPDSVKTDGKYLYLVKGSIVYIILAYPVNEAKILSKIDVDYQVSNIFINGDRLIIFGRQNKPVILEPVLEKVSIPWYGSSNTYIKIYDIKNKYEPVIKRDVVIGGTYYNARMIDDHIYIITNQNQYDIRPNYDDVIVPVISENGIVKKVPVDDIYCIDIPYYSYVLTHVVSINVENDDEEIIDKIFTMSNSQTMYVSRNNIYISYSRSRSEYKVRQEVYDESLMPLLSEKIKNDVECARNFEISENNKKQVIDWILDGFLQTLDQTIKDDIESEIQRRLHSTIIHKISVVNGKIEYLCNGTVPGNILNQFSMDEHNGFFRVATHQRGNWRSNNKKTTNVYILEADLSIIGRINNIAPGENLHSARFIGSKAYLVTFKKIDPFFTLDLSDPYNPKILGELKIPGFSDYLHPIDENHIIGVGLDTVEPQEEYSWTKNFAWYQGVKIAIFDVSDFKNPKVLDQVIIGDRGTRTTATNDHKAFLFDREKELLVLPISLYEISEEIKSRNDGYTGNIRGNFKLNGAYVFQVSINDGFNLKGVITHNNDLSQQDYNRNNYPQISRSLYIDNALYTISNNMVKINGLDNLNEITNIKLT